jgi:hypothetical protein
MLVTWLWLIAPSFFPRRLILFLILGIITEGAHSAIPHKPRWAFWSAVTGNAIIESTVVWPALERLPRAVYAQRPDPTT